MPLREQSRIKADTVAEECTCEECPAPAPDVYTGPVTAGMRFGYKDSVFVPDGRRGAMGEFLDAQGNGVSEPNLRGMYRPIPAPAPEPSAPPAGVPVCHRDCGKTYGGTGEAQWASSSPVYATRECAEAERCLNPPPSDPVTVATGGVPAGYRLGAGWTAGRECHPGSDTSVWCDDHLREADFVKRNVWGNIVAGACRGHALLAGALVPIDTAAVPPGPVPVEACAALCPRPCSQVCSLPHGHVGRHAHGATDFVSGHSFLTEAEAAPPAAPARGPAVRPKAPRNSTGSAISPMSVQLAAYAKYEASENDKEELMAFATAFAAIEAELVRENALGEHWASEAKHARAEVEQLRAKLAEAEGERDRGEIAFEKYKVQATARVRSMREAAAKVVDGGGWICVYECGHDKCVETRRLARAIRALPLDTGTVADDPSKVAFHVHDDPMTGEPLYFTFDNCTVDGCPFRKRTATDAPGEAGK